MESAEQCQEENIFKNSNWLEISWFLRQKPVVVNVSHFFKTVQISEAKYPLKLKSA